MNFVTMGMFTVVQTYGIDVSLLEKKVRYFVKPTRYEQFSVGINLLRVVIRVITFMYKLTFCIKLNFSD